MAVQPISSGPPSQGMRLAERIDVLATGVDALDGLPGVLWQGGAAELVETLSVADRLARGAAAARYAAVAEAVSRGEVAASQAGSLHQWVRAHAPGLAGDGLGVVVKAVQVLASPANADFDVAVRGGRVSPGVALACAGEWAALEARVTDAAAPTVREALIAVGEVDGVKEVRRLRPALLARYGMDGEFQADQDALKGRVALSTGRTDDDGLTTYEFCCDPEGKAVLEAAIGPLARPVPDPDSGARDARTAEQRRGQALVEALRRTAQATSAGGTLAGAKATVVVTMAVDDLRARLGSGTVQTSTAAGTALAPETVRRLACDALVIPAVLGASGDVLDWGLEKRLFQPAQVKALWVRDGGCTFPGCTAPAGWCDAHHIRHWVDGGPTDLSNAALVCGRHHTVIHRDHLIGEVTPTGVVWDTTPRTADGQPSTWPGGRPLHPRRR